MEKSTDPEDLWIGKHFENQMRFYQFLYKSWICEKRYTFLEGTIQRSIITKQRVEYVSVYYYYIPSKEKILNYIIRTYLVTKIIS